MAKKQYYDISNILKTNASYMMLLGQRTNGKSYQVKKVVLEQDNEFEDIVYDDSKGMDFLYWKAYKNCQSAIEYNRNSSN